MVNMIGNIGVGEREMRDERERERERDANKIAKRRRICSMKIYFYHNNENKTVDFYYIQDIEFYFFLFFCIFVFY